MLKRGSRILDRSFREYKLSVKQGGGTRSKKLLVKAEKRRTK